MGCTSSTEAVTNPHTGQVETKKKLGGAYPGQRRPHHATYTPDTTQFDATTGQAVVHFKAYGGGNALTLVQQDGSNQPVAGAVIPEYVSVTLPAGVTAGQTIHVQAPSGKINAIIVPEGFGPGSTFTVEFAPDEKPVPVAATTTSYSNNNGTTTTTSMKQDDTNYHAVVPPVASNTTTNGGDDGFASGFNNPNYRPPQQQPTVQQATTTNFSDDYYAQYPTTHATPVGYK